MHTHGNLLPRATRAIAVATGVAAVLAAIISWRASHKAGAPAFLPVLGWQLLVWAPWLVLGPGVEYLGRRFSYSALHPLVWAGVHLAAALAVAMAHLFWYYRVSDALSPYYGVAGTKYGAFAYFFIFWFLIDLLLFWALLAWSHRRLVQARLREALPAGKALADRAQASEGGAELRYIPVRTGRRQQVIRAEEVDWIEAQGYYAALHVGGDTHLVRESLAGLSERLDSKQFVRVHRSTIANLRFIDSVEPAGANAWSVKLADGTLRRLSRAGKQRLKRQLPLS